MTRPRYSSGRRRSDRDVPRLRLLADARNSRFLPEPVAGHVRLRLLAVDVRAAGRLLAVLRLVLLRRLVHGVQDTEIVLRVLEVALRHHPVATAGRVAAELEIFLEQLLSRPADPKIGAVAVEYVVAVERDPAAMVTNAASAASAARPVVSSTHAFHVHSNAVALSCCSPLRRSRGA